MKKLSPVEQVLCCALADDVCWQKADLIRFWRNAGDDVAWDFAVRNRVESVVGLALSSLLPPQDVPARWHEAMEKTEKRLQWFMEELDRVAARFAENGIPMVALKNAGIARGIFPHLAGCPMGDVDVLVDSAHFRAAHRLMLELGYELAFRGPFGEVSLEKAEKAGGAEYTVPLPDGSVLWLELQWRPVAGRWLRPDQELEAAALLARSISIPGTEVRLLSPEDNLMQVCLHTAKHSFVRAPGFRLHADVDRIIRRCRIDWDTFTSRVRDSEVQTAVYLSLRVPATYLRTPIPAEVLDALCPCGWKTDILLRWIESAGLFEPDHRKWSRPGYILFNMMLYDSFRGLTRGVFPPCGWMKEHYQFDSSLTLPYHYAKRLLHLLLHRAST